MPPLDHVSGGDGSARGQKVFTLQTVPAKPPKEQRKGVAQTAGFSLHAGIGIEAHARSKLARLARYVSRPAVSEERLALTERGEVRLRPVPKHVAMSWARRLKRVFAIEIERCRRCGGKLLGVASIEEPALIERILAHLQRRDEDEHTHSPFISRAPPQPSLL